MTMDNVRRLFEVFETDKALRKALYMAEGTEAREAALREAGLFFTDEEFDAMIDSLHVKCQTHEEAERFFEFRNWWDFLRRS
ncbi:Nif11 family protein [Solidesulfovibrio sp.]